MAGGSHEQETKTAIILVDHGSRTKAANAVVEVMARHVAERAGDRYVAVLPAHMELAAPTVDEAYDAAVACGADLVIVVLFFLGPGRHSTADVPALTAAAAARYPATRYVITDALGPDPLLAELVLVRAGGALAADAFEG